MLEIYRDHWWAEVISDVDAIMATMPTDAVSYHFDGLPLMMPEPWHFTDPKVARQMYQSIADLDLPIAGPFDNERFAFGDWGMSCEALLSSILPGRFLSGYHKKLDPDQLYFVQWHSVSTHPMDVERRLMLGENVFTGSAVRVEPVDRSAIAKMLG